MTKFKIHCVDENIKALPTVGEASGSVASFDTDMTENLVEVVCDIQYSQASGTPSPSNPLPITVYNSLNLSHSGADTSNPNVTNIPFGQTVAKGTLNVTTGVLEITHSEYVFDGTETPIAYGSGYRYVVLTDKEGKSYGQDEIPNVVCNEYNAITRRQIQNGITGVSLTGNTILLSSDTPSGVQVVYELATPLTIQLSATQITALLNENNIWCDTGDTSVKYILSVGKAIS